MVVQTPADRYCTAKISSHQICLSLKQIAPLPPLIWRKESCRITWIIAKIGCCSFFNTHGVCSVSPTPSSSVACTSWPGTRCTPHLPRGADDACSQACCCWVHRCSTQMHCRCSSCRSRPQRRDCEIPSGSGRCWHERVPTLLSCPSLTWLYPWQQLA